MKQNTNNDLKNSSLDTQQKIEGKNIIAIASGKGGVGKTCISVSLAHAFALKGLKVLLVDGDLGLSNIDIQLGLPTPITLANVFAYNEALNTAIIHDEITGCDIIAGHSGSQTLAGLTPARLQLFCDDLKILATHYDKVIIDLGTGIQTTVTTLASIAGEILIVTTDSPTSLADSYAFINTMKENKKSSLFKIIINMANTIKEGEKTYQNIFKACQSFLNLTPLLAGIIHQDSTLRQAVQQQEALLNFAPESIASKDILNLANHLLEK